MASMGNAKRPKVIALGFILLCGACESGVSSGLPSGPGDGRAASLAIEPESVSLAVGESATLDASAKDSGGQRISGVQFTWSTSDSSIAVVDSGGSVQGVSAGSATITASGGGKNATATVTVAWPYAGKPALGKIAWGESCQGCHTGAEGWDIAHFGYTSADILRRARPHVPDSTARDVLAYIRTLAVSDTADRNTPIFQPGGQGAVLSSDLEFAISTFGVDAWPDTLTPAGLRAHDTRSMPISLRMPTWSDEASAYDWLPGDRESGALPPGVRADAWKLNNYYANPTLSGAVDAAKQILVLAHNSSDGPCRYPPHGPADLSLYDPVRCFDVAKWAASLIYVEGVRSGQIEEAGRKGAGVIWEAGHMAHKSGQNGVAIQDADLHTAAWTYLGWQYDLSLVQPTLYTSVPLSKLGLHRQSTWFSLRTLVERDPYNRGQGGNICSDVREPAEWGHVPWIPAAMAFAYEYLISLLRAGWVPPDAGWCDTEIKRAQYDINNRAGQAAMDRLQPLADSIAVLLGR